MLIGSISRKRGGLRCVECFANSGFQRAGQASITRRSQLMARLWDISTSKKTRPPFHQTVQNPVSPMPHDHHAITKQEISVDPEDVPDQELEGSRKGYGKGYRHSADRLWKGSSKTITP